MNVEKEISELKNQVGILNSLIYQLRNEVENFKKENR